MPRALIVLVAASLLFLGFLGGVTSWFYVPGVAVFFDQAFMGASTIGRSEYAYEPDERRLFMGLRNSTPDDWLNPPAPDTEPGVYQYDPERVQPGYTLYTPVFPWQLPRLVDFEGNEIWKWYIPQVNEWGERDDGIVFPREINPAVTDVHLFPDGRLLMLMAHDLGYQPYGFAALMLDKNSQELWRFTEQVHHQADVAPDGRIAVMVMSEVTQPRRHINDAVLPFFNETIVILSPEGEELERFSVLRAFNSLGARGALKLANPDAFEGDVFHLNSVKFLDAGQAANLPGAEEGDLLLSLRDLDLIAVLSVNTGKIVWMMKGPWFMQHDPDVVSNGNVLLFDNRGDLQRGGRSRLLEVDPKDGSIVWEWPGDADFDLFTSVAGSAERLANGNTLISETNRGRILEITRAGDVVWEYQVPERVTTGANYPSSKVWHARRFDPQELDFLE